MDTSRGYGRPRGGVNAIKRASIRPSRRTSLISKSSASPCPASLSATPASRSPPSISRSRATYIGSYYEISAAFGEFRVEMRVCAHEEIDSYDATRVMDLIYKCVLSRFEALFVQPIFPLKVT